MLRHKGIPEPRKLVKSDRQLLERIGEFRIRQHRLVGEGVQEGFERVLVNKYYVDEIYDEAVVQPTVGISRSLLWEGVDKGLIDGLMVNFFGTKVPRFVGWAGSQLQSGQVGTYAWVLVVGVLLVLGAFTIR